jgi:multicomponent K+:H+ antiporter subunit A
LWLPVGVLVMLVVGIGILPALIAGPVVEITSRAVIGAQNLPEYKLALWHGFTPALFMSLIAFAGGALLLLAHGGVDPCASPCAGRRRRPCSTPLSPARRGPLSASWPISTRSRSPATRRHHRHDRGGGRRRLRLELPRCGHPGAPAGDLAGASRWAALVATCATVRLRPHQPALTLILTSIVGLGVSLAFVQFSAPDLALTQISVEVVTTILLLLALNLLPRKTPAEGSGVRKLRDGALAGLAGAGIGALAYAVLTRDLQSISAYHLARIEAGRRRHQCRERHPGRLPRLRHLRRDHRALHRGAGHLRPPRYLAQGRRCRTPRRYCARARKPRTRTRFCS